VVSNKFRIRINDDGTVHRVGVEAGKTKVLAMDNGLIALHVAGGTYWSGIGSRSYSPAHIAIHRYEETDLPDEFLIEGLFGELEFKPRSNEWKPSW
jgi:hypothetical protein